MLQTLMQYQNMTVRVDFSVDAPNELNRTSANRRTRKMRAEWLLVGGLGSF
jgi:hypothetical protein